MTTHRVGQEVTVSSAETDCGANYDERDCDLIAQVFAFAAQAIREKKIGEVCAVNGYNCMVASVTIAHNLLPDSWYENGVPVLKRFGKAAKKKTTKKNQKKPWCSR